MITFSSEDIIQEALEICGVLGEGEEPTSDQTASVLRSLNMLVKAWQTDGIKLWTVDTLEIPLVEDKVEYSIGPNQDVDVDYRPIRILNGVWRDDQERDIPLNRWSREEYWRLSEKGSRGATLNYWYDRRVDTGQLYVWQAPFNDDTKLVLQAQRSLETDRPIETAVDFPAEYVLALSYNLALMIAPKYGLSRSDSLTIAEIAREAKSDVEDYDRDDTSLYLEPDYYTYGW